MPSDFLRQRYQNAKVVLQRRSAAGAECTLRLPGICRRDPAYTIAAHLRRFGAASNTNKPDDLFLIYACDACHDVLDMRVRDDAETLTDEDVLRALVETLRIRRRAGLITLKGEPEAETLSDADMIRNRWSLAPAWDFTRGSLALCPEPTPWTTPLDEVPRNDPVDCITYEMETGQLDGQPAYRIVGRLRETAVVVEVGLQA